MFRLLIKFFIINLLITLFISCSFIDLTPIGISTVPKDGETLSNSYTPVIIKFDTKMEKYEAEKIVTVSFSGGQLEGDLSWNGNDLYFLPVKGWYSGVKYILSLTGTVFSKDGRELRLDKHISFYAISKAAAPFLTTFSPADGESVGVTPDQGGILKLYFSKPMDRMNTEEALSINGFSDKIFNWYDDDCRLEVNSKDSLSAWTTYNWTLSDKAVSRDGVPFAKTVSAQFSTNIDTIFPEVLRITPMIKSGVNWIDTGGNIETELGHAQAIGIVFNKDMDIDTMLRSISFSPTLAGRSEQLSNSSFVFIPDRNPDSEVTYTLTISGETKDSFGLKIGKDYVLYFTPDITFLKITNITVEGMTSIGEQYLGNGTSHKAKIIPPAGELKLSIKFSINFTAAAKADSISRISLDTFFPRTLSPIALRAAYWLSDDTIRLEWEGLETGTTDQPHYYQLIIPGSRGGITNGNGSFFKENINLFIEAIP